MKKKQSISSTILKGGAIQIAGLYLLIGGLWILFSDQIATRVASNQEMLTTISLYKGWGYVLVTAFMLFLLIQRYTIALRTSEKQLQRVMDALPVLISYVDADGYYQFSNNAYEEWFGHKVQGKHIEEVLGTAAYKTISKYVDTALRGETATYETEIQYQDGGTRFVNATHVPDIGSTGQVKGFFALVQDITEHKQTQEELKLWADAFEGCAHGIAISDPDSNRITVCNPAFASMHKCRVEDIVGSAILSLYAPTDYEHVRHNIEKADQIGHASYEAHMVRRDGSIFPVQMDVVSVLGEDGELLHRVATAQDITERKQAEEESKSLARFPSENPHPVLQATHDGKIIYANPASDSLLEDWHSSVGGYLPNEWIELIHELINTGARKTIDVQCKNTFYSISIVSIPNAGHVNLYGMDITKRKQAEANLRNSQMQMTGIINSAMDAIISADADQRILIFNSAAEAMFRCSQSEAIGQSLDRFIPQRFRINHGHHMQKFAKTGVTNRTMGHLGTVYGLRQDGEEFPIEASISKINIAGNDFFTVILRDITERKRAEQAQQLERARWQGIVEGIADEVWMCDTQGKMSLLNLDAVTAMGLNMFKDKSVEEIYQEVDIFYTDGQPRPPEQAPLLRSLRGEIVRGEEIMQHRQTGASRYRQFSSAPTRDSSGAITGAVAIVRDITEQKVAEEGLRRFELLSEHSRDIILFINRKDGHILEANAAAMRDYQYSREELLTLTIWDLRASNTQDLTTEQMDQADAGGILFETVHRRKDGTIFPVEVSSQGTTISGVRTLISIIRDITERKQAEEELQKAHDELELKVQERTAALSQANSLLQALMDYMPDQIYFKDTQGRFIRNSRSQASLLGLSDPAQTVGKTDFDFFPHAARAYAEEQEVMRSGKPLVDLEEWVVWPGGKETWVSTTKVPLRNAEGQTIGIFGISRDITERKRTEQAIRQLNADLEKQAAQLESANKELEAFSYSVSHDLRAPLRAIDGYTRILVEDYEANLDAEGKRVCGIISAEARRMGQLIDDLLSFSRLGRKQMYTSKIDMNALAISVFNELVKDEERERIDFQIAKLHPIKADSSLIRQVWINLLSNAIKFTSKKERAVIEVGNKQTKEENIYYVRDNGAGFDMEYANKLFGVFQRLHSESEFEGTGVGLAIVQRIIRRHGGHVWAQGEVEKGATFYFALPRKENTHE